MGRKSPEHGYLPHPCWPCPGVDIRNSTLLSLGSSGPRVLECNPDQRLLRIHHHSWESTTWISAREPVDSTSAASLLGVSIAGTLGSVVLERRQPAWRTGDRRLEGASQGVEGVQVAVEVVSEELPGREFSVTGLPSMAVVENDP